MIETEPAVRSRTSERSHELAPNVWLRQGETEGQFVEIVMPPLELSDLLQECVAAFPHYAVQVCKLLADRQPDSLTPQTRFTPELMQGLLNTQILGTVLERHQVQGERAVPLLPELRQAFGLALQGRLRLSADPLPDV